MSLWNVSQLALWVVVLFNLLLTYALIRKVAAAPSGGPPIGGLDAGTPAPSFEADTPDGKRVSDSTFADRAPLVLGFFSPTCGACEQQMPDFAAFAERAHGAGVRTLAVLDGDQEQSAALRERLPEGTTALLAPRGVNPMLNDYRVEAYPSYTVIRADGTVDGTYGAAAQLGDRLKAVASRKARR